MILALFYGVALNESCRSHKDLERLTQVKRSALYSICPSQASLRKGIYYITQIGWAVPTRFKSLGTRLTRQGCGSRRLANPVMSERSDEIQDQVQKYVFKLDFAPDLILVPKSIKKRLAGLDDPVSLLDFVKRFYLSYSTFARTSAIVFTYSITLPLKVSAL